MLNYYLVSKPVFIELLKDEVFVDYLNKFLTLPIFGQRSLYVLKTDEFIFEPNLTAKVKGVSVFSSFETSFMMLVDTLNKSILSTNPSRLATKKLFLTGCLKRGCHFSSDR